MDITYAKNIVDEKTVVDDIQSGKDSHYNLGTGLKNCVNAIMADKIQIGDTVQIVRSGKIGTVTKKIKYGREYQNYHSPNGYTAIQVEVDGRKHSYSGRSLRIINKGDKNR